MPFRHDSTGIDPEAGNFILLPEGGWYTFSILTAKEGKSKKGNDMLNLRCVVLEPKEWEGTSVFHIVAFLPANAPGAGMSVHFRKCIGMPYGGDDEVDGSEWEGRTFIGKVGIDTYEGKRRNKIVEVAPVNSPAKREPEPEGGKKDSGDIPF